MRASKPHECGSGILQVQHKCARRVPAAQCWSCSTAPQRSPALPRRHRALPHTAPPSSRGCTSPQTPAPDRPAQAFPNPSAHTPAISHSPQGQTGSPPYATPPRSTPLHPTPPAAGRVPQSQPRTGTAPGPPRALKPPSQQRCRCARRPRPRPIARPGSPPYLPPCWVRRLDSRESHRPHRLAELSAAFSREQRCTSRFGLRPLSAAALGAPGSARAALWRRLRPQAGSELCPAPRPARQGRFVCLTQQQFSPK